MKPCKFSSSTRSFTSLRSCRAKTSAKDPEGTEVLDQVPTTGAEDAKMQKDPNVSPQASETPSATTRLTRKSRERQPTKRCKEWLKHDREL